MFKKMMLAMLIGLTLSAAHAQAGVRLNIGIGLPLFVPLYPRPRPVYVAPPPVYVVPAPAPIYLRSGPPAVVGQPAPTAVYSVPVPAPVYVQPAYGR